MKPLLLLAATILALTSTGCSDGRRGRAQGERAKLAQAKAEAELAKAKGEAQVARAQAEAVRAELEKAKIEPKGATGPSQPKSNVGAEAPGNPLANMEGCFILAEDKQYLGETSSNEFDSDSILNEFGRYGSKFSGTSIFNDFGRYGGTIAPYSPFNPVAANPPNVFTRDGAFVAYLTVNNVKSPRIDPRVLIGFLKAH